MTNYAQKLRDEGRYHPEQWRREREAKWLRDLQRAWYEANESVRAEFIVWAGWLDASEKPAAGDEGPLSNCR
jgi:hypothetical protein